MKHPVTARSNSFILVQILWGYGGETPICPHAAAGEYGRMMRAEGAHFFIAGHHR